MSRHYTQTDGRHLLTTDLAAAKQSEAERLEFQQAADYDLLPEHIKAQFSRATFNRLHNIECAGCGLVSCQCDLEMAEAEEMWQEQGLAWRT